MSIECDTPSKKNYTAYTNDFKDTHSALGQQVAGDHYKSLALQPFEITFANFGYQGVQAAAYTKVNKYLTREKGKHRENLEKAIHCLQIQLEFLEITGAWDEQPNARLEPTFSLTQPIDTDGNI